MKRKHLQYSQINCRMRHFDRNVSLASGWPTMAWLPDLSSAHSTSFDEGSGNWEVTHVSCFSGSPSLPPGELALQGCTVHVYDQGPVTLQKVHSTIAEHLQELQHQGLLGEEQQLRVSELASYPGSSSQNIDGVYPCCAGQCDCGHSAIRSCIRG